MVGAFIGGYNSHSFVVASGFDAGVVTPLVGLYVPSVASTHSYFFESGRGFSSGKYSLLVGSDADHRYASVVDLFGGNTFRRLDLSGSVLEWFNVVHRARVVPSELSDLFSE
jgi:hypothetical protein